LWDYCKANDKYSEIYCIFKSYGFLSRGKNPLIRSGREESFGKRFSSIWKGKKEGDSLFEDEIKKFSVENFVQK